MRNKGGVLDRIKEWIKEWNKGEMRSKLCQSLGGMKEMSKVYSEEHGVQGVEYGGQQHRGKDLALTYVLHPCQRTRLSPILEETSRGDTRGLYCQEVKITGRDRGLRTR